MSKQASSTSHRRIVFFVALAAGVLTTACQAVLEFDRGPLQPVYEASVDDEEDAGREASTSEGGREGGSAEAGRDAAPDATPIVDSGADADGG